MSASEVARLRREGRYDEAYDMAISDIMSRNDEWSRSALFWTLRDICVYGFLPQQKLQSAEKCTVLMERLMWKMPADKGMANAAWQALRRRVAPESTMLNNAAEMSKTRPKETFDFLQRQTGGQWQQLPQEWHDTLGWIIYRYIKAEQEHASTQEVRIALYNYIRLSNRRPSTLHSLMLETAMRYWRKHGGFGFYKFVSLWNTVNFRNADMQSTTYRGQVKDALIKRVFATLAVGGEDINIQELISPLTIDYETALDLFRHPIHDRLAELHAQRLTKQLWQAFTVYAQCYPHFGPSEWHSRILLLATQYMTGADAWRFPMFLQRWGIANLRTPDWLSDSTSCEPSPHSLALTAARLCADYFACHHATAELATTAKWAADACRVMDNWERVRHGQQPQQPPTTP